MLRSSFALSLVAAAATLLLSVPSAHAARSTVRTAPVTQVIDMLTSMAEKGKASMQEEEKQFAAYSQFCADASQEKARLIAESERLMEEAKSTVEVKAARIQKLTTEINANQAQMATNDADLKASAHIRDRENEDFLATDKDYTESIEAIEQAVAVLQNQNYDRKQGAAAPAAPAPAQLLQVSALPLVPAWARAKIQAFIATGYTDDARQPPVVDPPSAPKANAYEFQSTGIVDMLEKLKDKFIDERTNSQKVEANNRHAYEMLKSDVEADNESRATQDSEMSKGRSEAEQAKGEAEGALADAEQQLKVDSEYKRDLDATCQKKAADFDERTKLRNEELEAIAKAVEILSGPEVTQAKAKMEGPTTASAAAAVSLLQLRKQVKSPSASKVARFLQGKAKELNSRSLTALALQVAESAKTAEDPFKKVRQMIKDLIFRLQKEATEEAEQKAWCAKNLQENERDRKKFGALVEETKSTVEQVGAEISQLATEISELEGAVVQLNEDLAKATELRARSKAENEATVQDARNGQEAVARAIELLRAFYARAEQATALLQQQRRQTPSAATDGPAIFDSAYTGMQAESGGVIGMLEVIETDFARLQTETETAEAEQSDEFFTFKSDTRTDVEVKKTTIDHKTGEKQTKQSSLEAAKGDLKAAEHQLGAAMQVYEHLKDPCITAGGSYNDRVDRRASEIQSLKEALRILSGEEFAQ